MQSFMDACTALTQRAVRDAIAAAGALLVSTSHMRDTVVRNGIAPERIIVTPPPLVDDAFCARPAALPKHVMILFAARFEPQKGLRSIIRGLSLIEPSRRG